jgi:hypothetical protein
MLLQNLYNFTFASHFWRVSGRDDGHRQQLVMQPWRVDGFFDVLPQIKVVQNYLQQYRNHNWAFLGWFMVVPALSP